MKIVNKQEEIQFKDLPSGDLFRLTSNGSDRSIYLKLSTSYKVTDGYYRNVVALPCSALTYVADDTKVIKVEHELQVQ